MIPVSAWSAALPLALLLLAQACTWPSARAEARALQQRVEAAAREVAEARGRAVEPPPIALLSAEEMSAWLAVRHELDPEARARTDRALRAFGILAPDQTWQSVLASRGSELVAGAYDVDAERIVLLRPADGDVPDTVIRHELAHALQDQHWGFDLDRSPSDLLAVDSLIAEGDATYTELVSRMGGAAVDAAEPADLGLGVHRSPTGTPLERYLRTIRHPYVRGVAMVRQLRLRGGWEAVDAVWQAPPLSTKALLLDRPDEHPRYARVDVSAALGPGWRADPADTLGASVLADVLYAIAPEEHADAEVEGWDGDRLQVLYHEDGRYGFVWRVVWDEPWQARRFATTARRSLAPRGEPVAVEVRGDEVLLVSGVPLDRVAEAAFRDPFVEVEVLEALKAYATR